jgi:hypothetical protein
VGKYPRVKTLRRLVLPQAPSPIMTSFLGSVLADGRTMASRTSGWGCRRPGPCLPDAAPATGRGEGWAVSRRMGSTWKAVESLGDWDTETETEPGRSVGWRCSSSVQPAIRSSVQQESLTFWFGCCVSLAHNQRATTVGPEPKQDGLELVLFIY